MQSKRKLTFNTVEHEKSTKNASTYINALFDDSGLAKGDGDGQRLLSLGRVWCLTEAGRMKFQICTLRSPKNTINSAQGHHSHNRRGCSRARRGGCKWNRGTVCRR